MNKPTLHPSEIATSTARPLPVIFLLDVSSSMGECIHVLNAAVRKIFVTLAKEEKRGTEFLVSIVTFGADARLQLPPTKAGNVKWADFRAGGGTPLGSALLLAKQLIEDKDQISVQRSARRASMASGCGRCCRTSGNCSTSTARTVQLPSSPTAGAWSA
jgi:Mg-chelatase subunit ChlD